MELRFVLNLPGLCAHDLRLTPTTRNVRLGYAAEDGANYWTLMIDGCAYPLAPVGTIGKHPELNAVCEEARRVVQQAIDTCQWGNYRERAETIALTRVTPPFQGVSERKKP